MANDLTIYWMRRDFRLRDNPALDSISGPVLPVFIRDFAVDTLGAAPKFRLARAIEQFSKNLSDDGGQLLLRSGDALEVLQDLIRETGATRVVWNRLYDPSARTRDAAIKRALKDEGIAVESFNAHLLFEPWTVETGTGGPYRVYSPFWRAVRNRDVASVSAKPSLQWPAHYPRSEALRNWGLDTAMNRGAVVVAPHLLLGEGAAASRLDQFLERKIDGYKADRDQLHLDACSGLSEPLSLGEIGPRQIWHKAWAAMEAGASGAEHFLKELVWREFAYHLMFHTPRILTDNWRDGWDHFPWQGAGEASRRWQQGQTGVGVIDAAQRELYVTGRMHNRARMLVASYLTKHLMVDWRVGLRWFEETLVDWDPASNAMGWQWVAGSGPDASPFFRIFNPETQAEKFDREGRYRAFWLDGDGAAAFHEARPISWQIEDSAAQMISLAEGRTRALAAYETVKR